MGVIRLINNLICALGCLAVALAMGILLWLPTRPWVALQIQLAADAQPISLPITGYEALMLANGLASGSQQAATAISELGSRDGGSSLLGQYELSERQQVQIRDLAVQTRNLGDPLLLLQIALFVLPALTLFMALIVLVTRGYFGQQLLKGVLLVLLTFCATVVLVGTMVVVEERLNAVIAASLAQNAAGFPGLGVAVNDALPELRVGLQNLMNTRVAVIAGVVALVGSVVALLGACVSARRPALTQLQLASANAAMMQAQAQAQIQVNGKHATVTPSPSTQRIGPAEPTAPAPPQSQPQPMTPQPQSQVASQPQACAVCGQPVSGKEKFCRHCGARLSGATG